MRHKPWAGLTGIHGNSASENHPPDTVTLAKSVEILTNPVLTKSPNEGGKGREKKQNKRSVTRIKQAAQQHSDDLYFALLTLNQRSVDSGPSVNQLILINRLKIS